MCYIYPAGGVIQRVGLQVFRVCNFEGLILKKTLLSILTMDPEPEQNPLEEPTEAPGSMMMERSNSESGSNSSLSTDYGTKGMKSGSAASSRSGSGASTSRSPSDQEIAARLLSGPSPSFDQGHKDDDHPSESKIALQPSSEEKKNDSPLITKDDSSTPQKPLGDTVKELEKGADKILAEFVETETVVIKEVEEAADTCCDYCCRCCTSCAPGICGDVAAVLCCPLTFISLLSCICFRCPKLFATKTAEKVKSRKRAEESEFEESTDGGKESSDPSTVKDIHGPGHHEKKPEPTATVQSKDVGEQSGKLQTSPKMDVHRSYFFPSPEVEDDHPGSDKPGGR